MTDYPGQMGSTDYASDENATAFAIRQHLARVRTALAVKVVAVHAGGQPDQWTVDVLPLAAMIDGAGKATQHGTVFNIPVMASSGANGAIIVKPAVGDIGLMVCADRDHSSVVRAKGPANPGSKRMHDLSDGFYLGGFGSINTAAHYIVADENGFTIKGNITVTGAITATGGVTAGQGTGDQVTLQSHTHGGVQSGGSLTAAPTAGT
jgi:hypothetical protein